MTEKRFWYDFEDPTGHKILDFKNDNEYPLETIGDFREVVDLMNGLTAKNKVLCKEIERLKIQNKDLLYSNAKNMESLEKENKQLKDKYNEQSVQYEGLEEQVERLLDFKDNVFNLIDELIKKAEKDVEDLRKDAYEKGYAYNPYYYWGVAHGLKKLKEELQE